MSKIHVFDLDNTITKVDTFYFFIIYFFIRSPHNFFSLLRFGVFIPPYLLGCKNGTWLKKKFIKICLAEQKKERINLISNDFSRLVFKYFLNNKIKEIILNLLTNNNNNLVIISASLDIYVNNLGILLGLREENILGTKLEFDNDILSGNIKGKNLFGKYKVEEYKKWLNANKNLGAHELYFYSDHHRDIPFFEISDHKILVNPTKKLKKKYLKKKHTVIDI